MSLLTYLVTTSAPAAERNDAGMSKLINNLASFVYIVILGLAVFLAVRDMGSLHSTGPKVWLFCLAIFAPELYVILHGLSSSSMGMPFFSDAMVDVPASLAHGSVASVTPSDAAESLSGSVAAKVSSTLRKAAAAVKSDVANLGRAASKLVDDSASSSSVPLSGTSSM